MVFFSILDRPVTFNISSEPVIILDHLKLDAFVMTIPIYDPDNGDFIQDFELDYKNEYFYLDTKRSKYNVDCILILLARLYM